MANNQQVTIPKLLSQSDLQECQIICNAARREFRRAPIAEQMLLDHWVAVEHIRFYQRQRIAKSRIDAQFRSVISSVYAQIDRSCSKAKAEIKRLAKKK